MTDWCWVVDNIILTPADAVAIAKELPDVASPRFRGKRQRGRTHSAYQFKVEKGSLAAALARSVPELLLNAGGQAIPALSRQRAFIEAWTRALLRAEVIREHHTGVAWCLDMDKVEILPFHIEACAVDWCPEYGRRWDQIMRGLP